MSPEATRDSIRPLHGQRIYDLVEQAGVDVRPWSVSKTTGADIDPYSNMYRNSQWTFGGKSDPLVACIWWSETSVKDGQVVRIGNSKDNVKEWGDKLASIQGTDKDKGRLRIIITKAQAFDRLMSEAYLRTKPVRVVVLEDDSETDRETPKASKRRLDEVQWWVHSYDVRTGEYLLVRDVPPPPKQIQDPFNNAPDPAEDTEFFEWIDEAPLAPTEKEAIIRIRVGQGYFRDSLIDRWKGCAITQCKDTALLTASHIKPWSQCTTRTERLSPDNGILLSPNLDKAFDRGYISFDDNFKMLMHPKFHLQARNTLPINPNSVLTNRTHAGMKPYLKWHRQHFGFEPKEEE